MQDLLIEVPLRRAVLARQAELALQRGSSAGRVADGLERGVPLAVDVPHEPPVVVRSCAHVRAVVPPPALELVEDAIALVELAQLGAQVLVHLGEGVRVRVRGRGRGRGRVRVRVRVRVLG